MANVDTFLKTEYRIVIFPVATYRRYGELAVLTVFGIPVYKKAGDKKSLFGIKSRIKNAQ